MHQMTWHIGSIDADRWEVYGGPVARPSVSVRGVSLQVPGVHGANRPGLPVFDEPTVALRLVAKGDPGSIAEAESDLLGRLSHPNLTLGRTISGERTNAPAALVSLALERQGTFLRVGTARLVFLATFAIPGAFFRGEVGTSPVTGVSSGDVVEVTPLQGSTAPATDAVVRIAGTASQVTVTDALTGTGLSWSESLSSSQYLYLHAADLTARRSTSGTQWASGGTDVSAAVSYPASGPLQLWPVAASGARRARLRVTGSGFGAGTTVAVRAAGAYL